MKQDNPEFEAEIEEYPSPSLIRKFRRRAGLTQEDVAHMLDVTQQTVSRWERPPKYTKGKVFIKRDLLIELANQLACEVDDFFKVRFKKLVDMAESVVEDHLIDENNESTAESKARTAIAILNLDRKYPDRDNEVEDDNETAQDLDKMLKGEADE